MVMDLSSPSQHGPSESLQTCVFCIILATTINLSTSFNLKESMIVDFHTAVRNIGDLTLPLSGQDLIGFSLHGECVPETTDVRG